MRHANLWIGTVLVCLAVTSTGGCDDSETGASGGSAANGGAGASGAGAAGGAGTAGAGGGAAGSGGAAITDAGSDADAGPECGPDGVWHDTATDLLWQNPPSPDNLGWAAASTYCADIDCGGHHDWRLPTVDELRSLIRGCANTETGGPCNVEEGGCLSTSCWDTHCYGCPADQGPAGGCYWPDELAGECAAYWSSTTVWDLNGLWHIDFSDASIVPGSGHVRCVRIGAN